MANKKQQRPIHQGPPSDRGNAQGPQGKGSPAGGQAEPPGSEPEGSGGAPQATYAAGAEASCTLGRPVFFIGFMGAGKTSVSRRLARMCRISSIDLDTYIERREDKKVKDFRSGGRGVSRDGNRSASRIHSR